MIFPIQVPSLLAKLCDHLVALLDDEALEPYEATSLYYRELGCELDPRLFGQAFDGGTPIELCYTRHPFELVPFGWQGGDALHYGYVAHVDGQPDYPCVSYAPSDDTVSWLGDDTNQALSNLVAVAVKHGVVLRDAPKVRQLCDLLDLRPSFDLVQLTPGARSNLRPEFRVPAGWRYEPTQDGVGVLAPAAQFSDNTYPVSWNEDEMLGYAESERKLGKRASELVVLRNCYTRTIDRTVELAKAMQQCYAALDRRFLVDRAQAYIDHHG